MPVFCTNRKTGGGTALGVGIAGSMLHVEGRGHFRKGMELFNFNARRNAFQKSNSGLYFGAGAHGVGLLLHR